MGRDFNSILDECLEALERGESIQACLARYPRETSRLRPLLSLARQVRRTPLAKPRPGAQAGAWQRLSLRAAELRRGRVRPAFAWWQAAAIAASLVLAVVLAGGGTVYAAQRSLPDSPLYRVKLATEEARLWFAFDDEDKADILLDQSEERIEEILALVREGKPVPGNVLGALRSRTNRALDILEEEGRAPALRARAQELAARHQELLVSLWDTVSPAARDQYAAAVATLHNARLRMERQEMVHALLPSDVLGGVTKMEGTVEDVRDSVVSISGLEVRVDQRTFGPETSQLRPGSSVSLVVARGADNRLRALSLLLRGAQQPDRKIIIQGVVEQVGEDEVQVAGHKLAITETTLLKLQLHLGQRVEITADAIGGQVVAAEVEDLPEEGEAATVLAYEGTIEELGAQGETSTWQVGGQAFVVTAATDVDLRAAPLAEGARARIEAVREDGKLVTKRVMLLASEEEAEKVALQGVFEGAIGDRWLVSGIQVDPPRRAVLPTPGTLVKVEGEQRVLGIRASDVLEIRRPGREPTLVNLQGMILDITGNRWRVGLVTVEITAATRVRGLPQEGARALVWGRPSGHATLEALYVDVLDSQPIFNIPFTFP